MSQIKMTLTFIKYLKNDKNLFFASQKANKSENLHRSKNQLKQKSKASISFQFLCDKNNAIST